MATNVPAPGVLHHGDSLAGRLEWLCQAVRAQCACSAEERVSGCDAWERQLDLALDCYAQGEDDAAALAIMNRLDEQMSAWAAKVPPQAGGPAAAGTGNSEGGSRRPTDHG
jgi:hypothetical protein